MFSSSSWISWNVTVGLMVHGTDFPSANILNSSHISGDADSKRSFNIELPLVPAQYVCGSNPDLTYLMTLQGLYTSAFPNLYPSYHSLASMYFSGWPYSSHIAFTSSLVNPNISSKSLLKMLFTSRLFNPENILSLEICMTPVITPNMSESFPFNAEERMPLMISMMSLWKSLPYALWIGLSYSSRRIITFFP